MIFMVLVGTGDLKVDNDLELCGLQRVALASSSGFFPVRDGELSPSYVNQTWVVCLIRTPDDAMSQAKAAGRSNRNPTRRPPKKLQNTYPATKYL